MAGDERPAAGKTRGPALSREDHGVLPPPPPAQQQQQPVTKGTGIIDPSIDEEEHLLHPPRQSSVAAATNDAALVIDETELAAPVEVQREPAAVAAPVVLSEQPRLLHN